jgi:hypothetical protein
VAHHGVLAGGTSTPVKIFTAIPTGGIVLNGTSSLNAIYFPNVSGGVITSGQSSGNTFDDIASGGVVLNGIGLYQLYHIPAISGGATIAVTTASSSVGVLHIINIKTSGGCTLAGTSIVLRNVGPPIFAQGGVAVGSRLGLPGAIVSVDIEAALPPCHKDPLPRHPKPSTADYRPANIAPLIEFFAPIVSISTGLSVGPCSITFRYENNTPCLRRDDIFVQHPDCSGLPYTKPTNKCLVKSQELKNYEARAKKSNRLRNFEKNSPAGIKYFTDGCGIGLVNYPPGNYPDSF